MLAHHGGHFFVTATMFQGTLFGSLTSLLFTNLTSFVYIFLLFSARLGSALLPFLKTRASPLGLLIQGFRDTPTMR